MQCLINFRPVTPTARSNTPSGRVRNLPCADISNKESSSCGAASETTKHGGGSKQDDVVEKGSSLSVDRAGVKKTGRQHARRSLHYDNNENIIDDLTTDYVLSRKRPVSPESAATEQPRKRRRTEHEPCTLELLDVEPLQTTERRTPQKLSAAIVSRKSGQWKVSTPSPEQALTPRKRDGATPVGTPSKSVTFHDSVVGGNGDDVDESRVQSPMGTPRSGKRCQRLSVTSKCESPTTPSRSAGKLTPRTQQSVSLTPKSGQKRTPGTSAEAGCSTTDITPRRSSARIASAASEPDSGIRRGHRATPRTDEKRKDLPARRILAASSPGTGRVLRPRTPRSYKCTTVWDEDDDLYNPDAESSDEEQSTVKKTPSRKTANEVFNDSLAVQFFNALSFIHHHDSVGWLVQ